MVHTPQRSNQLTRGSLVIGESVFGGLVTGTVTIDPASVAAGETGTVDVTIAGVDASDVVVLEPPATLEDGLVVKGVRAKAGGADLDLYNPTGGAVDAASADWTYKVIKFA